jgi:hypothetical protein
VISATNCSGFVSSVTPSPGRRLAGAQRSAPGVYCSGDSDAQISFVPERWKNVGGDATSTLLKKSKAYIAYIANRGRSLPSCRELVAHLRTPRVAQTSPFWCSGHLRPRSGAESPRVLHLESARLIVGMPHLPGACATGVLRTVQELVPLLL